MRVDKFLRTAAPLFVMAAATGLAGCDGVDITVNGEEGVPLSELDMSGDAPEGIALGGSDAVVITTGDEFTIDVDGSEDAVDRMRFILSEGTLAIHREDGSWSDTDQATVLITMPAPSTLALGGSGSISTDGMASNAEIVIGGSGEVLATNIDASSLDFVIGGSGNAEVSGRAERLDMTIAGSGSANMAGLQVERADINIGGSGDVTFSSDGSVEANIAGSGTVRVRGSATCNANSIGSGRLICEEVEEAAE